jgi:hypothetical protein
MIKHFIECGMSLRLIMDFVLYLYNNKNQIDLPRFWNTIGNLKYSYFITIILTVAVKYLKFDDENFVDIKTVEDNDVNAVIDDLETGGWLGFNDKELRSEGWQEYNRIKFLENKGRKGYKIYMFIWNSKGYLKALFPSRKHLAIKFPYVQKSVLLIPIAWIHRFFSKGLSYISKGKLMSYTVDSEDDLNETAKKRVELFKQMKMI